MFKFVVLFSLLLLLRTVHCPWLYDTTYPYMDLYYRPDDPQKYCPKLICKYSGFDINDQLYIKTMENKFRDKYAFNHKISNMYSVQTPPGSVKLAQRKAFLCLPPTENTRIFDFVSTKELYPSLTNNEQARHHAIEVIIGSRAVPRNQSSARQMKYFALQKYSLLLQDESALIWRGGTTDMGCGYTLRKNDTHYIDHFVCTYGLIRSVIREYGMMSGVTCSHCTHYTGFSMPNGTLRDSKYGCDDKFVHLCNEKSIEYKLRPNVVRCLKKNNQRNFEGGNRTGVFPILSDDDWDEVLDKAFDSAKNEEEAESCLTLLIIIIIILSVIVILLFLFVIYLVISTEVEMI